MASRTVLTTGANSGIGLATVLELARRGYRSVGSVRSEAKAAEVHRAAAEAGVTVETVRMDVTDADACAAAVDRFAPWALVNNAGYSVTGAIEDVDDAEARLALETMEVANPGTWSDTTPRASPWPNASRPRWSRTPSPAWC